MRNKNDFFYSAEVKDILPKLENKEIHLLGEAVLALKKAQKEQDEFMTELVKSTPALTKKEVDGALFEMTNDDYHAGFEGVSVAGYQRLILRELKKEGATITFEHIQKMQPAERAKIFNIPARSVSAPSAVK